ncbi:MAG: HemY protein, partial [Gammaproteobacteria bacterium]
MVKFILWLLLLIILAMGAVLLVRDDPGFLMLRYRDYSLETTLAFGLVAVFVVVVVLHYLIRMLRGLLHLPGAIGRQSKARRIDKSRKQLNQGLIDLAEGRFAQAENNLIRLVAHSESPLLHYLAAAR